jgi:hypothetical protein
MLIRICLSLLLLLVPSASGQDRFISGEFKGFTKSPTEGVIIRSDETVTLRAVTGTVVRSVGDESPLEDTLIELRGTDDSRIIGAARTDRSPRQIPCQRSTARDVYVQSHVIGFSICGWHRDRFLESREVSRPEFAVTARRVSGCPSPKFYTGVHWADSERHQLGYLGVVELHLRERCQPATVIESERR